MTDGRESEIIDQRPRVCRFRGDVAGQLGVQAGQEGKVVTVEPVGDAVEDDGVDAGVEEKDLQLAAGGRVALLIGAQQFTQ